MNKTVALSKKFYLRGKTTVGMGFRMNIQYLTWLCCCAVLKSRERGGESKTRGEATKEHNATSLSMVREMVLSLSFLLRDTSGSEDFGFHCLQGYGQSGILWLQPWMTTMFHDTADECLVRHQELWMDNKRFKEYFKLVNGSRDQLGERVSPWKSAPLSGMDCRGKLEDLLILVKRQCEGLFRSNAIHIPDLFYFFSQLNTVTWLQTDPSR